MVPHRGALDEKEMTVHTGQAWCSARERRTADGHGDARGAVIGSREIVAAIRSDAAVDVGGVPAPFNTWPIMRGSVTLPLRLRQHLATAQHEWWWLVGPGRTSISS